MPAGAHKKISAERWQRISFLSAALSLFQRFSYASFAREGKVKQDWLDRRNSIGLLLLPLGMIFQKNRSADK